VEEESNMKLGHEGSDVTQLERCPGF
jgi:hypothetical protein